MLEDILIPISFFALVFALMYVYWTTRNKERMAMIEKGVDPTVFKTKLPHTGYMGVKLGFFLIGIAIGIFLGNLVAFIPGISEETAYFSMIILFGGLGLVAGHIYQTKKEKP